MGIPSSLSKIQKTTTTVNNLVVVVVVVASVQMTIYYDPSLSLWKTQKKPNDSIVDDEDGDVNDRVVVVVVVI